jgi:hypothetical protein
LLYDPHILKCALTTMPKKQLKLMSYKARQNARAGARRRA